MSKEFKRGKKAEQDGDYVEAVRLFRLAAEKDSAEATIYLAALLQQGRGVAAADPKQAAALLRPLADRAVPEACFSLANLILQLASNTSPESAAILADLNPSHSAMPPAAAAADLMRTAATKGHMAAQFRLGQLLAAGATGLDKDDKEAVRWYRKAADQNFPPAFNALGWMYEHQRGVDESNEVTALKSAYRYYRKAAEVPPGMIGEGFPAAQANLARLYATGKGVPAKDLKEAVKWFR
jgi:TPR repeat protein